MTTSKSFSNFVLIFVMQIATGSCQSTTCVRLSHTITCGSTELLYITEFTYYDWRGCNPEDQCSTTKFYKYPLCITGGTCVFRLPQAPRRCYRNSRARASVTYRCIDETFHNMCGETTMESNLNTSKLFLATPSYPQLYSFNTTEPCSCTVSGSSISHIVVLHLRIDIPTEGQISKFFIKDSERGIIYNATSDETRDSQLLVNYEDFKSPFSPPVNITFNHQGTSGRLLIVILGSSLSFRCIAPPIPTTPFTTATSELTTSPTPEVRTVQLHENTQQTLKITTSSATRQPGNSRISVPILIGSIVGGATLLVFVIIIIACSVKRRKKASNGTNNINQDGGRVGEGQRSTNVTATAIEYAHLSDLHRTDANATNVTATANEYAHLSDLHRTDANVTYVQLEFNNQYLPQTETSITEENATYGQKETCNDYTHLSDQSRADDTSTYSQISTYVNSPESNAENMG